MTVTVDREPLAAEQLGLKTVGQVLAHLQKANRLVVQVLIDGEEPDLSSPGAVRGMPLLGHTIYVETADPATLAGEVLGAVESQLGEAETAKCDAADLLQRGQVAKAMERLSGCLTTWQHAEHAVRKVAELLRIDLAAVSIDGRPLVQTLDLFMEPLRQIRAALEQRDFVYLSDILAYETTHTTQHWQRCVAAVRDLAGSLK